MKKLLIIVVLAVFAACETAPTDYAYITNIKEMEQTFQIAAGEVEWLWSAEVKKFGDSSLTITPDTQYVSIFRSFEREKQETFDALGDYYDKDLADSILGTASLHVEEDNNRFYGRFENPQLSFEFDELKIDSDLTGFRLIGKSGDTTITEYFEQYRWLGEK